MGGWGRDWRTPGLDAREKRGSTERSLQKNGLFEIFLPKWGDLLNPKTTLLAL